MNQPSKVLGPLTLSFITVAGIVSLRNLPLTAELGSSAVFFLSLAAIFFFIPIALITAELAATWPKAGGCYIWVSEAFGKPIGFISLWFSWMASIAWFPTILIFCSSMLAKLICPICPGLETNISFVLTTMLVIFWGMTLINFLGVELSGFLSSLGVIVGTILPGALIIYFGIEWFLQGHDRQIALNASNLIPSINFDNLSLFAGVILSFAGVELAAFHIRETKEPRINYPRAMFLAMFLILTIYIIGTLALALVIPQQQLSLAMGLMQAFEIFFAKMQSSWLAPVMALCLLAGALASINAWIIGPAKGMLVVAEDKFFPNWLSKVNNKNVPTSMLLMQAIIGSMLSILFLFIKDDSVIWIMSAIAAQFTCLQYMLMLSAAWYLRKSKSDIVRPYRAPFLPLLCFVGLLSCAFSFAIVYAPHSLLIEMPIWEYYAILILSVLILSLPTAYLIYKSSKALKN